MLSAIIIAVMRPYLPIIPAMTMGITFFMTKVGWRMPVPQQPSPHRRRYRSDGGYTGGLSRHMDSTRMREHVQRFPGFL